jgi:thiamine-phosphate pyrophosphorylase
VLDGSTGRFYPIIDTQVCGTLGLDPREVAAACFRGGARLLQLRVKSGPSMAFVALADDVVTAGKQHGAMVIVNDRADIAKLSAADGVHVGQDDLDPASVRRILGGAAIVGVSTHSPDQVRAASALAVDYIAVGPIFGTSTKETGYRDVGTTFVSEAARILEHAGCMKPIVAIGGITLERAPAVIRAGAAAVAVISDLLATGNPEARVKEYLRALS